MKSGRRDSTMHAAAFGAAALIASQVAGKATRDAFFLSQFPVTALPVMVIVASLLSVTAGFVTPRLLSTRVASRYLSWGFVGSAALLMLEWWISTWNPAMAAVLIYLQMTILGAVLISGFWSLVDDRFDARSARRQFGKIVAASTLGGVVGGVVAGRVGSSTGIASMLLVLGFLHLVCAFVATSLASKHKAAAKERGRVRRARPVPVLRSFVPFPMSAMWRSSSCFRLWALHSWTMSSRHECPPHIRTTRNWWSSSPCSTR